MVALSSTMPCFNRNTKSFFKPLLLLLTIPIKVDFIDAYGLGKWGEAHGVKYNNYSNKVEVFEWITDTYAKAFKRVPLVINYHRLVGDTHQLGEPHPDSKRLLERAIAKGYTIRHDAFWHDWLLRTVGKRFCPCLPLSLCPSLWREDGLPERTTVTGLILVASIARAFGRCALGRVRRKP